MCPESTRKPHPAATAAADAAALSAYLLATLPIFPALPQSFIPALARQKKKV